MVEFLLAVGLLFDGFGALMTSSTAVADATNVALRLPYVAGSVMAWTGGAHVYNCAANYATRGASDLLSLYHTGEGSGLDFANGTSFEVLGIGPKADVCYANAGGKTMWWLTNDAYAGYPGALLKLVGPAKPVYKQSRNADLNSGRYPRSELPPGTWLCTFTDDGRVNQLSVLSITYKKLVVKVVTWSA